MASKTLPRTLALVAGLLAAVAARGFAADPAPVGGSRIYTIDRNHSHVGFSIRHLVSRVDGRFGDFAGVVTYDPAAPEKSAVDVAVQAASINTDTPSRDNDLRSDNFFDVAKYPTLTFKSTSVARGQAPNLLAVTGDFTMHGVTKRITVPVELLGTMPFHGGQKVGFGTSFTVNRKDYGITWNRAVDQGGMVLGDDVQISIQLETGWEPPKTTERPTVAPGPKPAGTTAQR